MSRVVLAVGAEARGLPDLGFPVAAPGRELERTLAEIAGAKTGDTAPDSVVVVPMSFGREPTLTADCARTLSALRAAADCAASAGPRLALSEPLGTPGDLIVHLRAALRREVGADGALVMSPSIDPFADAELFRIARLARQYGRPELVEVAFDGGAEPDPTLAAGLERCRLLGVARPALIPAHLGPAPAPESAADFAAEPGTGDRLPGAGEYLCSPAVLRSLISTRAAAANHRLAHGDDGIHAGTHAEDGHGYAHSHTDADGNVYTHSH